MPGKTGTRLVRWIKRRCKVCGKEWEVQPHEVRQRPVKYCSLKCASVEVGLSLRRRVKWECERCGLKKEVVPSHGHRVCARCAMEERKARLHGINIHENPLARKNWLAKMRSPQHREAMRIRCTGMVQTGLGAKDNPLHVRAVHAVYESPRREQFFVDNIARFVRSHGYLFKKEDLKQRPWAKKKASYQCNATQGLSTLTRNRKSWKGWSILHFTNE